MLDGDEEDLQLQLALLDTGGAFRTLSDQPIENRRVFDATRDKALSHANQPTPWSQTLPAP